MDQNTKTIIEALQSSVLNESCHVYALKQAVLNLLSEEHASEFNACYNHNYDSRLVETISAIRRSHPEVMAILNRYLPPEAKVA